MSLSQSQLAALWLEEVMRDQKEWLERSRETVRRALDHDAFWRVYREGARIVYSEPLPRASIFSPPTYPQSERG